MFILIFTVFTSGHVFAQDKVVVVPLGKTSLPTVAAFNSTNGQVSLTLTEATICQIVAKLTSTGIIIANASGYIDLHDVTNSKVICSITKDSTSHDDTAAIIGGGNTISAVKLIPFGATRGFNVTEAGETTIRLVCKGSVGTSDVNDANLTVMFFPNEL